MQRKTEISFSQPSQAGDHAHDWVVFSTALEEGWLMAQCVGCGLHGAIEDPTKEEWIAAFHAPSRPYRWAVEERVVIKGPLTGNRKFVMRSDQAAKDCECYTRRGILHPDGYERVPAEITSKSVPLTDDDRRELSKLADFVERSDLCSFLLPRFLEQYALHTGQGASSEIKVIIGRIEAIDQKGLHCSPTVIAHVLNYFAAM
jgi:hypothetical protein